MDDFTRYLKKNLENPEFRKEWDALETETQIMRSLIEATGINQSNLSRIERGNGNPSVATLERIAAALGKKVSISFI